MKEVDIYRSLLENILAKAESEEFSQEVSVRWVGGARKLERLVIDGKIRMRQKTPGGKKYYNARQVLENCRCMRSR